MYSNVKCMLNNNIPCLYFCFFMLLVSTVVADIHSVRQWLDSLGLSRLEDVLIANGFDDINFLVLPLL